MIFLVVVVGRLALKRGQCERVLVENAGRLQIVNELVVLLKRTRYLLPCNKLGDLLR